MQEYLFVIIKYICIVKILEYISNTNKNIPTF